MTPPYPSGDTSEDFSVVNVYPVVTCPFRVVLVGPYMAYLESLFITSSLLGGWFLIVIRTASSSPVNCRHNHGCRVIDDVLRV